VAYLRPSDLWWQPALGGAIPLLIPMARDVVADDPVNVAHPLAQRLIDRSLASLDAVLAEGYSVPDRVLAGNLASSINGAALMVGRGRPELAEAARTVANVLLARPLLAQEDGRAGPEFRRRRCCLIYQLAKNGRAAVCGDCVLTA
jgi:hypothetical protein